MRKTMLIAVIVIGIAATFLLLRHAMAAGGTAVHGEIVETYCWGALHVGGPGHAKCGIACAKKGIPVAIYDARERQAFVLLPGRDKAALPPELVAAMGRNVTVHGEVIRRGGAAFVTVQSWELP